MRACPFEFATGESHIEGLENARAPPLLNDPYPWFLLKGRSNDHATLHYRVLIASKDERLLGCAGPETAKAIIFSTQSFN